MWVERLSPDDDVAVTNASVILCEAFGAGSFSPARVQSWASDPDRYVAIAHREAGVVAVGTAQVARNLQSLALFGEAALRHLRGYRVGCLDSSAVAPASRGKGIGRQVARHLLDWLASRECNLVAAASWASGGPNPSRPLLEKLGFRALADLSGEVHRIENLGGRPCPVCGAPCRCSGTLLIREQG